MTAPAQKLVGRSTPPSAGRTWAQSHDVQFYDADEALAAAVGNFLVQGIRVGQPCIVIATAAHRAAFIEQIRQAGIEADDLIEGRDIVWLDAREALASFMEGGSPNPELFEATVGNVFDKLMEKRRYLVLRAYGEMVDILWRDGKADAALELERLWNALARKYAFTLLCAYSKESLAMCDEGHNIEHICEHHTAVLPHLRLTS